LRRVAVLGSSVELHSQPTGVTVTRAPAA
jgi:hypothetical protein